MADFPRPALVPASHFDVLLGGEDPARLSRLAHESAQALLHRVRDDPRPEVLDRIVDYTDAHGIDAVAELWSQASAKSLPGALWRMYLLRALIGQDVEQVSIAYRTGVETLATIDPVVAGAGVPTGPEEVRRVIEEILRGAFTGDFGLAIDRAAAVCRLVAAGSVELADTSDVAAPERASELTRRAARLSRMAADLDAAARLWRTDSLD